MMSLFALLLAARLSGAATHPAGPVVVRFQPVFGPEELVLDDAAYFTPHNGTVRVSTLRFYISGLRVTYTDGTQYVELFGYHLIDAADEKSFSIALPKAPARRIKQLQFDVGVDSSANVSGAQGGDLEPARGMYWAWHSGYINAKLEGTGSGCPTPRHAFAFHIGGFQAPYNSRRTVTLPVAAPASATAPLVVRADVGRWLNGVHLAETNSVLLPGPPAMAAADACANMFSIAPSNEP